MNKRTTLFQKILFFGSPVIVTFLISCQQEDLKNTPQSSNISEEIAKIETSYREGMVKIENQDFGSKIETSMTGVEMVEMQKKVDLAVQAQMSNLENRYKVSRTLYAGYDVGVIPQTSSACPTELITFHVDSEDKNTATKWIDNPFNECCRLWTYKGSWEITRSRNVNLRFCRVDGRLFTLTYRSAVLKLGAYQNPGTQTIQRFMDDEDNNNTNSYSGDISPNISNSNTTLILVKGTAPRPGVFPDLGFEYAVMGWAASNGNELGFLYIDNEDSKNNNHLRLDGTNVSKVEDIIGGGANTEIIISKVR